MRLLTTWFTVDSTKAEGLHEGRGDGFAVAVAFAIVGNGVAVRTDVAIELVDSFRPLRLVRAGDGEGDRQKPGEARRRGEMARQYA